MLSKEIIKVLNEENIHLMHDDLDADILGTFLSVDGLNIIIVNVSIIQNICLYNTIVAEEIGHYFTSKGNSIPFDTNSLQIDLNYEKNEITALRWALNYFLPTKKIVHFILENNEIHLNELSNHFGFTEDFIIKKFYYMSLKQDMIKLDNSKFLVLSSYPTVYIYSDYERRIDNGKYSKTS